MPEQQGSAAAGWVGHVLAGHRIDALVGEGGMGVVYRATHLRLGRTVALKVLPPWLGADAEYRRRFEREAAIAASLEHPNVVPIYDAGHADGVLYLSMRFVDGEDLGVVLRREGRLGIDGLCAVLGPVADALDAVHEAGLVHRDVKPGNVLLVRSGRPRAGQVYLCDFGIAKGATVAGADLTSAGRFMGTPQYSSPEQIEGRWVDGRSDQYGLACLVYRCLTGEVPYPRPEVAAVVYAHLAADPPRPRLLRPELPAAVDDAVARAAAKHPDHRFPTCTSFLDALRAAARSPAPRPPAPPNPGPRTQDPQSPRPRPRPTAPYPTTVVPPAATTRIGPTPRPAGAPEPAAPETAAPETATPEPAAPETAPAAPAPRPAAAAVPVPTEVRAERGTQDRSVTVSWTPGGPGDVEYKITRLAPDGRWQVVGRTRSTAIVDGAVTPRPGSRCTGWSPGSAPRCRRWAGPPGTPGTPGPTPPPRPDGRSTRRTPPPATVPRPAPSPPCGTSPSPGRGRWSSSGRPGSPRYGWSSARTGRPTPPATRPRPPGRSPTCATSSTGVCACPARSPCPATSPSPRAAASTAGWSSPPAST
ncbi:hypothetical protein PHY01_35930 [Pseudonocardia hydrocarbonoxydans]|uniref:non-specific serine/threonine protein kinase n=1 Tax=Pseudonocardia hydrocarbonoxydans TaxID=76726 RepID=A0A4Y3WT79_9PSEU|nr:serine/threonine-protein kinase [Pseudonocardia hydrocarbonoxydans]GEC21310.1 hypothetical protein PHY01_35930 [Pseudonocardia hydrocarbonoxydans]